MGWTLKVLFFLFGKYKMWHSVVLSHIHLLTIFANVLTPQPREQLCLYCSNTYGGHCFIYIYSGYGKYSDPLQFFTLLYCSRLLKSFKFIFFLINVHTAPHIDRKTQNCWHFCRFIKKEKLKYHMVLSIQTLCCDTHIFNSGAVHFFWSSLRWFYTFIWVQLCLIISIGLD